MSNARFSYSLNTSSIRRQGASVLEYIDIASDAGYQGIEPWVDEIDEWIASGGSLETIRSHAQNRGVKIANLIAFFEWAVPEHDRREIGLSEAKRCFEIADALDCPFVATAPTGIHDRIVDIGLVSRHFADLSGYVRDFSAVPLLEFWGIAKTLGSTGEVLHVAAESGVPDVKMLADVFHMYKGTGHHKGFEHFGPGCLGLVHVNDYPTSPSREQVADEDRIYPGDGVAPWPEILKCLDKMAYSGMLSLELFNPEYWSRGPETVAREGMQKLKNCFEQ
ncbi:MAG: sugar phosphate isomerase/epimerase [Candidatus Latescibacteria bacterium]|jgi:2-keto-myo-inositol isomerase|nr:sugar phosphate isomerase/epimerase [Candidatus Latescibacterota bacterium]